MPSNVASMPPSERSTVWPCAEPPGCWSVTGISQGSRSCLRRSPISVWRRKMVKRVFSSDASCTMEMLERSTISLCPRAAAAACSISTCAVGDGGDELRGHRGVARELGGGGILLDRGRGDGAEHRLHVLDHADDLVHRGDQLGGVVLQLADPPGDLVGRLLGLDRQRLDLVGDHREAAAGGAGAGGLDLGIERQQIGLLGDRGDHVDDIADLAGGLFQAVEAPPGAAGDLMDLAGQRCWLGRSAG